MIPHQEEQSIMRILVDYIIPVGTLIVLIFTIWGVARDSGKKDAKISQLDLDVAELKKNKKDVEDRLFDLQLQILDRMARIETKLEIQQQRG